MSTQPTAASDGRADRARTVRLVVAAVALVLAIVLVVQNNEPVELRLLFVTVTTPLWVGFLITLVLGALLGQAAAALRRRRT